MIHEAVVKTTLLMGGVNELRMAGSFADLQTCMLIYSYCFQAIIVVIVAI